LQGPRVASSIPGELIPRAFLWLDPRNYPMCENGLLYEILSAVILAQWGIG